LNLLTAACAALVLTLLARSVLLLGTVGSPSWAGHSRPTNSDEVGRGVPTAPRFATFAPALLPVTSCGLQLSFWEHATAFSGEMLDLLIFAYIIRCLFEFRNDRESWLFRSAFIYSAGMANNWAMIGYFPLYVVAVLSVKNFGFKRVNK